MSKITSKIRGGQTYESPALDLVEIEVEQYVFQNSLVFGGQDQPGPDVNPDIPSGIF